MLFHEEERGTILKLTDEHRNHFSPVEMTFAEGDSYLCEFNTSWESDNGLDDDDPEFDEYWEVWYDISKVLILGPNLEYSTSPSGKKSPIVLLTYKHFPSKITCNGKVIFESE